MLYFQANSSESKVASVASTTSGGDLSALDSQIKVQGDKVRELKLQKAEKVEFKKKMIID